MLVVCSLVTVNAQNREKNRLSAETNVHIGYAPGFNEDNVGKDLTVMNLGIGIKAGYFVANNFNIFLGVDFTRGFCFNADDDTYFGANSTSATLGVEYFFLDKFSANVGFGVELLDFGYGNFNGLYQNLRVPFGVTYWYKPNCGISLGWEPAVWKDKRRPKDDLLNNKLSGNTITLGWRFRFR